MSGYHWKMEQRFFLCLIAVACGTTMELHNTVVEILNGWSYSGVRSILSVELITASYDVTRVLLINVIWGNGSNWLKDVVEPASFSYCNFHKKKGFQVVLHRLLNQTHLHSSAHNTGGSLIESRCDERTPTRPIISTFASSIRWKAVAKWSVFASQQ